MRAIWRFAIMSVAVGAAGCAMVGGEAGSARLGRAAAEAPEPDGDGEASEASGAGQRPGAAGEMRTMAGDVTAVVADVTGLVAAIRTHTAEVGGSIAREDVSGDAQHRQASAVLRLPPAALSGFVDWLGGHATIDTSHVEANDVTRRYFDRDVAIRNLEVTLDRLHELARRPDADLDDILKVEHEATRVRGELEKLRGEQRLLADQVARATLAITITMSPPVHAEPALKFELLPHLTRLHLIDAGARAPERTGGGVTVMASRAASFDFEVLAPRGEDARSYLFTIATGVYSDFLGGGQRRFGNPYVGVRAGGAKMNGLGAFAYGVDAGIELLRYKLFLVEVSGRALGLWYNRDHAPQNDLVLEGTLGIGVPF